MRQQGHAVPWRAVARRVRPTATVTHTRMHGARATQFPSLMGNVKFARDDLEPRAAARGSPSPSSPLSAASGLGDATPPLDEFVFHSTPRRRLGQRLGLACSMPAAHAPRCGTGRDGHHTALPRAAQRCPAMLRYLVDTSIRCGDRRYESSINIGSAARPSGLRAWLGWWQAAMRAPRREPLSAARDTDTAHRSAGLMLSALLCVQVLRLN